LRLGKSEKRRPSSKLHFSDEEKHESDEPNEKPKADKLGQKIKRTEAKAEKYIKKRDKYRSKQPVRKKHPKNPTKERFFDESAGKAKTRLVFEEETIPFGEAKWNMPKMKPAPCKAAAAIGSFAAHKLHSKVYEAEQENAGAKAAHRAELAGESAFRAGKKAARSAYRFARNTPYRRAGKFEAKSISAQSKLSFQKAVRDNPKLQGNAMSRLWQKRRYKKRYADAYRNAKKLRETAKKAEKAAKKPVKAVARFARKHPVLFLIAAALGLTAFLIASLSSMFSTSFPGGTAFIGAASYAAEDTEIDKAALRYTERETDLQLEIQNAETTHGGYDEYRYHVGDIGHDPFELLGFLTAAYGKFTYPEVEGALQEIFSEQYSLTFEPETTTRTRTETRTETYADPETGEDRTDTYTVDVEYEWRILNINLASKPFSQAIYPRMGAGQREHFEILMLTKGARQFVGNPFGFNWLPYVTSHYGYRVHPISGAKNCHKGIDIGVPIGTEIRAGFDGVVKVAAYDSGYGNYAVIEAARNGTAIEAKYAHCQALFVAAGQAVSKGEIIATVGNTGNSTGPHLHMEVAKNGQSLDPLVFTETGDDGRGRLPPGSPGGIAIPAYSGEPMDGSTFEALLAEAQRYIGMRYRFGGSSPSTGFDCSGYLCYILNQSGAASFGRTTAQGLFNHCAPVSRANAKPGDLIFFHSTYSCPNPVTHVALYLGGDSFIHCGDPIGYGSLGSSYWQQHFYSFGRLR